MKKLLIIAIFASSAAIADNSWFTPHASYSFDILSSYISRGKVCEDRPIQVNEIDINFGLADFGRIGFNHWNYSCLTGKYQSQYRRFMPETDWAVYYEYDYVFADDWKLTTQLMPYWETYYGSRTENDPSTVCWRLKQTLKNPYVTPYYKIHYNAHPVEWWYYQVGVKRAFELFQGFSLTPTIALDFADNHGRTKRFGAREFGGNYGSGIVSMIAELTAEYAICEYFSLHATIGQFCVMDSAGRDNLDDSHKRDLTFGQVGFTLGF